MQCTHCKQGVIKEQQQQIHNQKKKYTWNATRELKVKSESHYSRD